MATVREKRELLSVETEVRVIGEKETGKTKSDVCREFSIVNFTI
jgi:hypothetical protein